MSKPNTHLFPYEELVCEIIFCVNDYIEGIAKREALQCPEMRVQITFHLHLANITFRLQSREKACFFVLFRIF